MTIKTHTGRVTIPAKPIEKKDVMVTLRAWLPDGSVIEKKFPLYPDVQ